MLCDYTVNNIDEDCGNNADYWYDTVEECEKAGVHLTSCDTDGYCNNCGNQASQ